ncbi:TRAP transporter small permease [Pseudochelatococcus sp. B33]
MTAQIVSRGLFGNPLGWPEMLSQMLLIWASVLGAVGAAKRADLVRIESLLDRFPGRMRRVAEGIGVASVLFLLAVLAWKGLQLTQRTSTSAHPLPVTWAWGYAAAPAFSVLMAVRLIQMSFLGYRFDFVEASFGPHDAAVPSEFGNLVAGEGKLAAGESK